MRPLFCFCLAALAAPVLGQPALPRLNPPVEIPSALAPDDVDTLLRAAGCTAEAFACETVAPVRLHRGRGAW